MAPDAGLVCFDASAPWPLTDGFADAVFCHDAFYFLPEKPHVAAEMRRVAGQGTVLVGHAHNALMDNLSSGSPLPPAEYAALFDAPLLYDDRELTTALVQARAPVPAGAEALADAAAIAIASGGGAPRPVVGGVAMPSPGTELRLNPLYSEHYVVPAAERHGFAQEGRHVVWPSQRYEREYGPLVTYPVSLGCSQAAVAGESIEVDDMARRRVLLDLPVQW